MIGSFLRGFLDGSLSTLGIVVGASAASSSIIIAASVGGTLANGISNVLSAFSAQRAEQSKELREVESAMVDKDLKDSAIERQMHGRTLAAGGMDGLATILGGTVPIFPYTFLSPPGAMFVSIALVLGVIGAIGIYLGRLSKRNVAFSALKMVVSGASVAVTVYLVQRAIVPS